jgi:hypothetical protein
MIKLLGNINTDATLGEKKVASLLQNVFDQDEREILCYYEPLLGELRPDLILQVLPILNEI